MTTNVTLFSKTPNPPEGLAWLHIPSRCGCPEESDSDQASREINVTINDSTSPPKSTTLYSHQFSVVDLHQLKENEIRQWSNRFLILLTATLAGIFFGCALQLELVTNGMLSSKIFSKTDVQPTNSQSIQEYLMDSLGKDNFNSLISRKKKVFSERQEWGLAAIISFAVANAVWVWRYLAAVGKTDFAEKYLQRMRQHIT